MTASPHLPTRLPHGSLMTPGKLLRGGAAALLALAISTAIFLCFGIGLPNWIYGKETLTYSPDGSMISFAYVSLGSIYSLFVFILLTVYFYGRFTVRD